MRHSENLASFLHRNRFEVRDLIDNKMTKEDFHLLRSFRSQYVFANHVSNQEMRRLNLALILASTFVDNDITELDYISRFCSELYDEEWNYALQFCPYYSIDETIKNLHFLQAAIEDSYLNVVTVLTRKSEAIMQKRLSQEFRHSEEYSGSISIMNFVSYYASFLDCCWRLRDAVGLRESGPYKRAIRAIISKNQNAHTFVKDYRNFQLHFRNIEPYAEISFSGKREQRLLFNATELLYTSFKWKSASKVYLQSAEKLDVIETFVAVKNDVHRVSKFIQSVVFKKMKTEKLAYETYLKVRDQFLHLQNAYVDIGAIAKKPTKILSRLIDRNLVAQLVDSSLSNGELKSSLLQLADKYKTLPTDKLKSIEAEIDDLISRRHPVQSVAGYLGGRPIE